MRASKNNSRKDPTKVQEEPEIHVTRLYPDKYKIHWHDGGLKGERHNFGNARDIYSVSGDKAVIDAEGFIAEEFVTSNCYFDLGGGDDYIGFYNLANTGNHIHGERGNDTLKIPIPSAERGNMTFQLVEDGSIRMNYVRDGITYTNTFESIENLIIGDVGHSSNNVTVLVDDLRKALRGAGVGCITAEEVFSQKFFLGIDDESMYIQR